MTAKPAKRRRVPGAALSPQTGSRGGPANRPAAGAGRSGHRGLQRSLHKPGLLKSPKTEAADAGAGPRPPSANAPVPPVPAAAPAAPAPCLCSTGAPRPDPQSSRALHPAGTQGRRSREGLRSPGARVKSQAVVAPAVGAQAGALTQSAAPNSPPDPRARRSPHGGRQTPGFTLVASGRAAPAS